MSAYIADTFNDPEPESQIKPFSYGICMMCGCYSARVGSGTVNPENLDHFPDCPCASSADGLADAFKKALQIAEPEPKSTSVVSIEVAVGEPALAPQCTGFPPLRLTSFSDDFNGILFYSQDWDRPFAAVDAVADAVVGADAARYRFIRDYFVQKVFSNHDGCGTSLVTIDVKINAYFPTGQSVSDPDILSKTIDKMRELPTEKDKP